jgi:tetratricopeptide (TPR) repeat protein
MIFRIALSIVVLVIFAGRLPAQNTAIIDSLRLRADLAASDSARVHEYVELSKTIVATDIEEALQVAQQAMDVAEKSGDQKLIAYACLNFGNAYFINGLLELSTQYYLRYIEINTRLGDEKGVAYGRINLGAVYLQLQQYERSRDYFEKALNFFEHLPDSIRQASPYHEMLTIYNNLGIACQNLKEYDLAEKYYRKGILLARQDGSKPEELGMLLNNLGTLFIGQGYPEKSLEYLLESFRFRQEANDLGAMGQSHRTLADYYLAIHDERSAISHLNEGYRLAAQVGNMSLLTEVAIKLFEIYQRQGNSDSALKYYIAYADVNEKLNREEAANTLTQFEITSKYEESRQLMRLEQQRKEQRYLFIGLTLLLILAIISLLYFLSHSRNKRLRLKADNIRLLAEKMELEKNNLEKELDIKKKELTTNVMVQIQKNELIYEIVQKLQKQMATGQRPDQRWLLQTIRDLERTQDTSIWQEFEIRFEQVHNDFYQKLNEIDASLTPNERRLCAFLKLNMSSKEISLITGQSPRTIDVARTRLRKKLNLTNSDTGLVEYLAAL